MEAKETIAEDRIKPIMCVCPFCGSYDVDPEGGLGQDAEGTMKTFPVCDKCGATAPSVEQWNNRTVTTEMIILARALGISPLHDDGGVRRTLGVALRSNRQIAYMQEIAEITGVETTWDWEELRKTDRIDTEVGYWKNLHDGTWEHVRTAEY